MQCPCEQLRANCGNSVAGLCERDEALAPEAQQSGKSNRPARMRALRERWATRNRGGTPSTNSATNTGAATTASRAEAWPRSNGTLENVTAARIPRATRLMSVCEKTVPGRRESCVSGALQAAAEDEHASRLADSAREDRRGHHADHRGAHDRRPPQQLVGQRGAQDGVPGDRARQQREHHQRECQDEPARTCRDQRMADPRQVQSAERVEEQRRKRQRGSDHPDAPRAAMPSR